MFLLTSVTIGARRRGGQERCEKGNLNWWLEGLAKAAGS